MTAAPPAELELEHLEGRYSICRLDAAARLPGLFERSVGRLVAAVRTDSELSLVCPDELAPPGSRVSADWAAMRIKGKLEHDLVGVLSSISAAIASAGVPLFAVSTFDTDYLLVPGVRFTEAADALAEAGYAVR